MKRTGKMSFSRSKDWYLLGINEDTHMPVAQIVCSGQTREDQVVIMQTDNSYVITTGAFTTVKSRPYKVNANMSFQQARPIIKESLISALSEFARMTDSTIDGFGIDTDNEKPKVRDFIDLCTEYAIMRAELMVALK